MSIEKARLPDTLSAKEGGRKWPKRLLGVAAIVGIGYLTAVNWEAIQGWWGENIIEPIADARDSFSTAIPEVMNGEFAAITTNTSNQVGMVMAA